MSCDKSDCEGCHCHISPPCDHCTEDHDNVDNNIKCKDCDCIIYDVVPIDKYDIAVKALKKVSNLKVDASDKLIMLADFEIIRGWANDALKGMGVV